MRMNSRQKGGRPELGGYHAPAESGRIAAPDAGESNPAEGPYTMGRHFMRRKGAVYVPVGVHYVPRSGPDWPWRVDEAEFDAAFARMAASGLTSARIDLLWAAVEPERGGMDEDHLAVVDRIFDAARSHGVSLHPTLFVGGEVGDAYWDLPWASGVNPHADPGLIEAQARHAAALARRWRGREELIAWDLTDEPPFWIHCATTTDADARRWTDAVTTALRENDPGHLVTIGTASQEVDGGPFRADVVADRLDFACVHPYPIYSPELYPDRLLSRRMTHSAAFETALARGTGRPVMVHEFGASSAQFAPEAVADYDRLMCWSSFGAGAVGFYAWCWIDAEPGAYRRAPYVRMPHETQFGLVDADSRPRPRAAVLTGLAHAMQDLDLDGLAGDGPWCPASIPVPYEYSRPYDRASYGLDDAPAGPYVPSEAAWEPERDVKPLVRGWLNSYVLASRAGLPAQFPREGLDDAWPATPVALLPAPLTSTTSSLLHMRTSFWQGALDYAERGGVIYLSCSAETAIPELASFAGVEIVDRAPVEGDVRLMLTGAVGGMDPGQTLTVAGAEAAARAGAATDLHLRGVQLRATDAQVLAVTSRGAPALTLARRGKGAVIVCAYPIELLAAEVPDGLGDDDPVWAIYRLVRDTAGVRPAVDLDSSLLTRGILTGEAGGILVATNHSAGDLTLPLRADAEVNGLRVRIVDSAAEERPGAAAPQAAATAGDDVHLPRGGAAIVTWKRAAAHGGGRRS